MEWLALPLMFLALGLFVWLADGGPQRIAAERRRAAEAREHTEELRLQRAELENGKPNRN